MEHPIILDNDLGQFSNYLTIYLVITVVMMVQRNTYILKSLSLLKLWTVWIDSRSTTYLQCFTHTLLNEGTHHQVNTKVRFYMYFMILESCWHTLLPYLLKNTVMIFKIRVKNPTLNSIYTHSSVSGWFIFKFQIPMY